MSKYYMGPISFLAEDEDGDPVTVRAYVDMHHETFNVLSVIPVRPGKPEEDESDDE